MIDIKSGTRHLKLTPYERIAEQEETAYSRIMVWIEFSVPGLNTGFSAEFTQGQVENAEEDLKKLYQSVLTKRKNPDIKFESLFKEVVLTFHLSDMSDITGVNVVLRPENHADSVTITDSFGLDESYFPAILSGLDSFINWPTSG